MGAVAGRPSWPKRLSPSAATVPSDSKTRMCHDAEIWVTVGDWAERGVKARWPVTQKRMAMARRRMERSIYSRLLGLPTATRLNVAFSNAGFHVLATAVAVLLLSREATRAARWSVPVEIG